MQKIDNILTDLNPVQREAVEHTDGPLLLLAGAGSGKTRVLTHKVAYSIKHKGVSPLNILAVTFTNKAAEEMRSRLEQLVGLASKLIWICTFHAACVRILRRDIERLGYSRDFTIFDTTDQIAVIRRVMEDLQLSERSYNPRSILASISNAKNDLIDHVEYANSASSFSEQTIAKVYREYQAYLKENNALDFDDLIMFTVNLFQKFPEVLDFYQEKFRYILVDEYQDTNHSQYVLIKMLAAKYKNICVVGDDDQSIYSWRGADIRNILDFEKDYQNVTVMRLEQNYRSTQNILDAAWNVVKHNRRRKDKKLWTQNERGDKIIYYEAPDEKLEADHIAQKILELKEKHQLMHRDFATFYRVNAQSRALEEGLLRAEIPYTIVGSVRFYERKEVKDVIAYLRLIANKNDAISLRRIINVPPRRIGKETLDKLENYAKSEGFSLYEALKRAPDIPEIKPQTQKSISNFVEIIEAIEPHGKPTDIITELLEKSGYIEMLKAEGTIEAEGRIENVKELLSAAVEFEGRQPETILSGFLESITLASDVDEWEEEKDRVTLMTLHSAKGLEFPVVFIAGLEEGLCPHQRAFRTDEEIEEERRLCYVGITRAKKRLYLSSASERLLFGYTMNNLASRFIDEIPQNLLQFEDETDEVNEESADYYCVGVRIRHAAWGDGEILEVIGKGLETIVKVRFDSGIEKSIMVEYAKIEKI